MAGYTQNALAEYVDVALSSIKRWESGHTTPQPAIRRRLANALDVTLDELDDLLAHDNELHTASVRPSGGTAMNDVTWPPVPTSGDAATDRTASHQQSLARAAILAVTRTRSGAVVGDGVSVPWRRGVDGDTVQQVRDVTSTLRVIDARYGGGACHAAAAAHLAWAAPLLDVTRGPLRDPLLAAIAEIHALIGWTAFDVGAYPDARRHLLTALELAQDARDKGLIAEVLYRIARVCLHQGRAKDALQLLQLGQTAAHESRSPLARTVVWANTGWVYAELGDVARMRHAFDRAHDSVERIDLGVEQWFRFFTPIEVDALRGVALTALTIADRHHADDAIATLRRSEAGRDEDHGRGRAFDLTALATVCLYDGEIARGVEAGHAAVDRALRIRSTRIIDRFGRLIDAAETRRSLSDVADLLERIRALRPGA
jgi:DNA-binding XRE family transcriptional regulator/tetratricopeptide (TPR) repeat protein